MAKLFYTRLSDYVLTASGGTAAGFLLEDLKTYDFRKQWKSGVNTNGQTLAIDMGSAAVTRSSMVLHNMSSFSPMAIDLEAATNSAFTTGKETVITDFMTSGTPSASDPQFWTFTGVAKRFWRLLFNDTSGVTPQLGQMFVDDVLDMQDNIESGWSLGTASQFDTDSEVMLDGFIKSSQQNKGRKRFEIRFTLVNDTLATEFTTFQQVTRGAFRPFYFNEDSNLHHLKNESDYSPSHGRAFNRNDIVRLRLVEPHATRS